MKALVLGAGVSASTWSQNRVQQWFEEIKLPQLKSKLDFFGGEDLLDLYNDSLNKPDDFKNTCEDSGLKPVDIRRLKSELRKLFAKN